MMQKHLVENGTLSELVEPGQIGLQSILNFLVNTVVYLKCIVFVLHLISDFVPVNAFIFPFIKFAWILIIYFVLSLICFSDVKILATHTKLNGLDLGFNLQEVEGIPQRIFFCLIPLFQECFQHLNDVGASPKIFGILRVQFLIEINENLLCDGIKFSLL